MINKLNIACDKSNLIKIRDFVGAQLQEQNLKDLEIHKIVLAVDEVCANLIIHSNACNPKQNIEVSIEISPNQKVVFIIKDQGVSFNPAAYAEPSMDDIISSRRKGGVGLMLVKRIMDKIEFTQEKNYNICRLIKKLD